MSWQLAEAPQCEHDTDCDPVELVIVPRARDLGDFEVRRALPAPERQRIGPFIFFDQMGPTAFETGQAMDVRPHPHIGLSTITWLFEGEIEHKDSLGSDLVIRPGEVNWMTAGKGIVHSERSPQSARKAGARLAGIQTWLALPVDKEEIEPAFYHYRADQIPRFDEDGLSIALIAGTAWGQSSPVRVESETLYAQINLQAQRQVAVPADTEERALYIYSGHVQIADSSFEAGSMVVLRPGEVVSVSALADTCLMLLGGAPLEGPRHLYWNFVSSSKDRIDQAKQDWREQRFAGVEGDDEFIPLPSD